MTVIRFTGLDRTTPLPYSIRSIVRMYERRPISQLFRCLPGIIQDPLINEFDFTFRSHRAGQTGNAIDDEAEAPLAGTQGFFRKPRRRDVRHSAYEFKLP